MTIKQFTLTFSNSTDINDVQDAGPFLYLNNENTGSLSFQPDVAATVTPGTLQPWQKSATFNPTGSVFYLFKLNTILSDEQIGDIVFDSGWQAQSYKDDVNGVYWAFTPKQPQNIDENQTLNLPLSQIVVGAANDLSSVSLNVQYYNVGGLTEVGRLNNKLAHFTVTLRQPPGADEPPCLSPLIETLFFGGREQDFGGHSNVEFVQVTTPDRADIANEFTLQIQQSQIQPGQTIARAGPNCTLSLCFVGAEAPFGALASPADLANIRVTTGTGSEDWEIIAARKAPTPYWTVKIPEGGVLSGQLHFSNIVTKLEWGWTELVVQYKGFPAYRDGQFSRPVFKYLPIDVIELLLSNTDSILNFCQYGSGFDGAQLIGNLPDVIHPGSTVELRFVRDPGHPGPNVLILIAYDAQILGAENHWNIKFIASWSPDTGGSDDQCSSWASTGNPTGSDIHNPDESYAGTSFVPIARLPFGGQIWQCNAWFVATQYVQNPPSGNGGNGGNGGGRLGGGMPP